MQGYLDALAAAAAAAALEQEQRDKLDALRQQFQAELDKPASEQNLAPVAAATAALLTELPEAAALRPAVVDLERRIKAQTWVAENEDLVIGWLTQ